MNNVCGVFAPRRMMRGVLAGLLFVPLLLGGASSSGRGGETVARRASAQSSQPPARASARTPAEVSFTAVDKTGAPLTTLKAEDVCVVVEGEPQESAGLRRQEGAPLALAFLIDVSASQERVLPATKRAAVALLTTGLRDGTDRAAVVSFTGEATLEQALTVDLVKARRAVERVEFVPPAGYLGGGIVIAGPPPKRGKNTPPMPGATGLWDAVWATCEDLLGPAKTGEQRVIVLLSDGVDTSSVKGSDEATRSAVRSNTVVYAVGLADREFTGVDKGSLRKLAERTGGRAFFPKKTGELLQVFEQVRAELLSARYVASFYPKRAAREGSFRKVRVELVNEGLRRQEVRLAHAEGFFAGPPPAAANE